MRHSYRIRFGARVPEQNTGPNRAYSNASQKFVEIFFRETCLSKDGSKGSHGKFSMERNDHRSTFSIPEFQVATTLTCSLETGFV